MKQNIIYHFVKKHQISKPLFIAYFVAIFLILYFSAITLFGNKGLIELSRLKKQIENKEILKKESAVKIKHKQNLVKGMSPESLDIDLLDEQTRKTLGYVGKNEVVIYEDKKDEEKK